MAFWNNWFRNPITELKLAQDIKSSRVPMPKPPPLDVSMDSLLRYSRRNELVYACIEKKAQAACDAELTVEKKNGEEWERVKGHPLVNLLNKPNPYDDGESFRRSWIASENFADVFYAEIVRSGAGLPVGLYPLHPALIKPDYRYTGKGWELYRYVYTIDGIQIYFKPEELLIRRRHSTGSVFSGVSALSIAIGSVDADQSLTEYVRAFFNNDGTPSGILKLKGRTLSDPEAAALKQSWQANYSRGGKNRGGIALLDDNADYQVIGSMLDELESDGITSKIESRICMAFGVPPILIGAYVGLLHVNQRASVREAQQDFWMNTMSPELKSIRSFLTWNLLPMFENIEEIKKGNIRVNWDMSQVEALQDDLDDIHKRAGSGYKDGIYTLNEARALVKLDAVDGETGDTFYQPKQIQLSTEEEKEKPTPGKSFPRFPVAGETVGLDKVDQKVLERAEAGLNGNLEKKTDAIGLLFKINPKFTKKTFEYNGLTLAREPSEIESQLNLKAMVDEFESDKAKLAKILLSLRESLINEAVKGFNELPDGELYQLVLTPPMQVYKKIRAIIETAFTRGSSQIVSELTAQGADGIADAISLTIDETAQQLTDLTVSRAVNEIQTRAIGQVASMGVLGLTAAEIREQLGSELRGQSDKWTNGYAGAAVNTATQRGRNDTIEQTAEFWGNLEYSAILDLNTCETCEEWDGQRASSMDELPDTPNPECDGMDRCRCFIVAIYDNI